MAGKTVPHTMCECGKRGFANRVLAEKAMGRAQTKRKRGYSAGNGSLRGLKVENRLYPCDEVENGLFHLTSESRRSYETRQAAMAR